MLFELPIVSIILGLLFLVFVFIEIKTKFHGVFIIVGMLINAAALFFLFYYGTALPAVILFLLAEILLFIIIMERGGKDVI